MKFENRVYGAAGISCINSNWNADFTGRPKSLSDGEIFGSDKAFKYPIKKLWENEGKKVMYMKSYKIEKDKLQPKMLSERYADLFGVSAKGAKSAEVLKNLFSSADVMNFGATFAEEGQNISITGAVQVLQGMNVYEDTYVEIQDILSPFRNSKKDEADASSLGKKITVNEAHYLYGLTVNPANYNQYIGLVPDFDGYTKEAYDDFVRGCCLGATALNTNSKSGCESEFAVFIKMKKNSKKYLPNIDRYINFCKEDNFAVYDLSDLADIVNGIGDVESIEIYYNKHNVKVITGGLACTEKDIFDC